VHNMDKVPRHIELEHTSNCWDKLLILIKSALNDQDWRWIKKISNSHYRCSQMIDQILESKTDSIAK
jgi:hypothetical protein